jgi:hypothetical protein
MALVKFTNVGGAGIILDPSANDVPAQPNGVFAWSGGGNIRFQEGYAEKFTGHSAPHGTPTVTPYGVFFSNTNSGLYEVYCGLQKIYAVANSTHTDITRALGNYTGAADNKWNGCLLSDILILNNGVDDPQYWNGDITTDAQKLTNWPANTKCKVMRSFDGALVALNITEGATNFKSMVRVSTSADPGTLPASWVALASNDAVRVEGKLSETPDGIVDGLELGERFMIYKENSTYSMHYIGGNDVYDFENVSRMSGALAVNCVTAIPGAHVVFSDGDIVINQGIEGPQSIIDQKNRRWLFNNLDSDNRTRSFAVTNHRRSEVWLCFPEVGMTWCNKALVWNYKENTFGVRDLPNLAHANAGVIAASSTDTWDSRTDVWNDADGIWGVDEYSRTTKRVMMASTDTGLYLADVGRSFNGAPMTAYLEHTSMDFKEVGLGSDRMKLCKEVRIRVDAASGTEIRVYVGSQYDLEDSIDWGTPQTFTVGTDRKVDFLVSGAYLSIKFESVAQGAWRISQFDMDIEDIGTAY